KDGRRFQRIADLRVLASNSLISLHIVRAAERLTGLPQFEEYLHSNLYTQDALLKCALEWSSADEDLMRLAMGNPTADRVRNGYGESYWEENGKTIAERFGGGELNGYSREPLPISHRPKDSFLWQRNARRLSGDHEVRYPGTDYLFVYWLCRYHHIIPEEPP